MHSSRHVPDRLAAWGERARWRVSIVVVLSLLFVSDGLLAAGGGDSRWFRFESLALEEGLSQLSVTDSLQDRDGFLWFGTQEGLNRYDGYQVREFKPSETDSNTISSNLISCLETDSQ